MKVSTRPSGRRSSGGRSSAGASASRTASHRSSDIAGILTIALALIVLIALITSNSGVLGHFLGYCVSLLFGKGGWAVPPLFLLVGFCLLRGRGLNLGHLYWGLGLIFLAVLGGIARPYGDRGDFLAYLDPTAVTATGGYVGALIGAAFDALLGSARFVGIGALGLVGLVLCVDVPIRTMVANTGRKAAAIKQKIPARPRPASTPEDDEKRMRPLRKEPVALPDEDYPVTKQGGLLTRGRSRAPLEEVTVAPTPEPTVEAAPATVTQEPVTKAVKVTKKPAEPEEPELPLDVPTPKEGYDLPPINLLAEALLQPKRSPAEMQKNIETLEGTLEQFGIDANVVEVATGPTITRFEIQLGAGIRVNRITALADNIAMDLAASQVRVEAPIPGKAAIGVEVPNTTPTMVTLRELCETKEFLNHPSRLSFALGKDVSGINKYADLTKMPHLLIGGATNSGKSIGLATLITSILMRNTPKDVRFVMIDPKRVELTLFDHIPHLMCPVIKDTKEAAGVLRAVWREMDRRYDLFSNEGVRNIDGWNAKASFQDKLPYVVVVIDELADLMIQHRAEVETVIVRLAQLARAVGIHMVLATQRPSVDVITGLIKANIPSRLAFSVASAIDSRTILDSKGAEALIGKGDMLFSPIDAIKPLRIQGCYVSEKEIEAVCRFWRNQQQPEYVLNPIEETVHDSEKEAGDFGEEADPFWEEAVRWVAERGQASTSMLQRKFSIGFQRASRLLDMMEERQIVGPRDGPRPREVLVNALDVDGLFGTAPKYDVGRTIGDGLDE